MKINEDDIVATYILEDGCRYIFMQDKTVYKKMQDGSLIKIELNKNNIKTIKDEIGDFQTDVR